MNSHLKLDMSKLNTCFLSTRFLTTSSETNLPILQCSSVNSSSFMLTAQKEALCCAWFFFLQSISQSYIFYLKRYSESDPFLLSPSLPSPNHHNLLSLCINILVTPCFYPYLLRLSFLLLSTFQWLLILSNSQTSPLRLKGFMRSAPAASLTFISQGSNRK